MPFRSFRSILDECLAAQRQGESTEACVSRYPKHAERLRPLLTIARRVSESPVARPRPRAQEVSWERVRQRSQELRRRRRLPLVSFVWLRPLALTASLAVAFLALTGGAAYAAQDSLPDSPFYRIKLATEDVRLWVVFDDSNRAEILLDQSDERSSEIVEMIQQGKSVPSNVLAALADRHDRATRILQDEPPEAPLMARLLQQSEAQEELLLALRDVVSPSAAAEYREVIANLHNTRLAGAGAQVALAPEDLIGGVIDISGPIEAGSDGIWQIGGFAVRIDERTLGYTDLMPGGTANLVVGRSASGSYQALALTTIEGFVPSSQILVSGAVAQITEGEIVVGGQRFRITPETLLQTKLQEGQRVEITATTGDAGTLASNVKAADIEDDPTSQFTLTLEGMIEGTTSSKAFANEYIVGGITFTLTPTTVYDVRGGDIEDGSRARVEAISIGGRLLAERVTIIAAEANVELVYLTGAYQGWDEGYWLVSGLRVQPPDGDGTPAPGSLVAIDALRQQDNVMLARQAAVLEPMGESGISSLEGFITEVDGDIWTIGVARLRVGPNSSVIGQAKVGARALVWSRYSGGEILEAAYIRVLDDRPIISSSLR